MCVILRQRNSCLGSFQTAFVFQGADLHHGAAHGLSQLFQIDAVAIFPHQIHHVDGDDHRVAQLHELGGEI